MLNHIVQDSIVLYMFQTAFNVIAYSDQMRLRTAVELIKATRDIESQLEKVSTG